MAPEEKPLEERLAALSPKARARVESALKANIESELGSEALAGERVGREFSRGIIFSRSRGALLMAPEEQEVLGRIATMDEAAFGKFAERLASLKQLQSRPSGE